jgi:hypothetical protein
MRNNDQVSDKPRHQSAAAASAYISFIEAAQRGPALF